MRRHLLLTYQRRRQRLLNPVPASPLLRFLARRHTLAAALGLASLTTGEAHPYPLPTAQPLRRSVDEVPQSWASRPETEVLPASARLSAAPPASEEDLSAPAVADRDQDQHWEADAADEEKPATMASLDEGARLEAGPVVSQSLPAVPPLGRARVIELGAANTPYDTIALDTSESDLARISQRLPASPGSTSEVAAAPERSTEAARLFRPHQDEAERSPQRWFHRLVEQARREQGQSAARPEPEPAPGSPSPGFPERVPGVANEQEPVSQTDADRVSRESGGRPSLRQASPLILTARRQAASGGSSTAAAAARSPEPPGLTARHFLKPLLGIDLAEVALYRDAQAARATEARAAAALSDANGIELAPQQEQTSPEGLGLLAHELTHVMRRRQPRFLPPIVRPGPPSNPGEGAEPAAPLDEEQLAIAVERQVRQQARAAFAVTAPATLPEQAVLPAPEAPAPMTATEPPTASAGRPPDTGRSGQSERGIWGKLPAPWEPLPAWLTGPPPAAGSPASEPARGAPGVSSAAPLPLSTIESAIAVASEGSSRAGVERSLATPVGDEGEAPPATSAARGPEPDLDALARQVYTLLKRRLSAEQRRLLS
ncbi:MAG: DUF4157 domain-containing protein [Thermogemmatispora sp.]|uniref:eCIS core domain-containing protein n=1 Tax=Thermogemmatispora sp. TaxID=1968838 RepID=UPI00263A305B|nr:DUF4157 domain-containing protein [Thermogemmatispora sp.]MBX5457208.1 DUF4157 domain-containing protein [Thermogemmatispora sp.]